MIFTIGILFCLICIFYSLVAYVNHMGGLDWLPQKMREVNIYEVVPHFAWVALGTMCYGYYKNRKESRRIQASGNTGVCIMQRMSITLMEPSLQKSKPKLLIHWFDTGRMSGHEMLSACGPEIAGSDFLTDCAKATSESSAVSPVLTRPTSLSATYDLFGKHVASRSGNSGVRRTFIITTVCEEQAQIRCTRLLEIPPAMLLLFWKDVSNIFEFGTSLKVQSYRFIAMRILAQQILKVKGQLHAWNDFEAGAVFAIRSLPVGLEPGEFNWWDPQWDFDPSVQLEKKEMEQKRACLIAALKRHRFTTQKQSFFPVCGDKDFLKWIQVFNSDLAENNFPPASCF